MFSLLFFRCPNNALDFYEAVKYVTNNTTDLGIDPERIAIAGESGGGYICAATMVHLARKDESHLVKLAVPVIPMLTDYSFGDTAAMTKEEAEIACRQQKAWRLIAGPNVSKTKYHVEIVFLFRWIHLKMMLSFTLVKQMRPC